jgi:hypothetical protein
VNWNQPQVHRYANLHSFSCTVIQDALERTLQPLSHALNLTTNQARVKTVHSYSIRVYIYIYICIHVYTHTHMSKRTLTFSCVLVSSCVRDVLGFYNVRLTQHTFLIISFISILLLVSSFLLGHRQASLTQFVILNSCLKLR